MVNSPAIFQYKLMRKNKTHDLSKKRYLCGKADWPVCSFYSQLPFLFTQLGFLATIC